MCTVVPLVVIENIVTNTQCLESYNILCNSRYLLTNNAFLTCAESAFMCWHVTKGAVLKSVYSMSLNSINIIPLLAYNTLQSDIYLNVQ